MVRYSSAQLTIIVANDTCKGILRIWYNSGLQRSIGTRLTLNVIDASAHLAEETNEARYVRHISSLSSTLS